MRNYLQEYYNNGDEAESIICDASDEIAELKRQLENRTRHRDKAEAYVVSLSQQLAESQARDAKLREALTELSCLGNGNVPGNSIGNGIAQLALALPHDDTALKEYRDAVIEDCATVCDTEWNGDADTYEYANACNECAEAVREMKSAVKSTAKGDLNVI